MSVCANITVLFNEAPGVDSLQALEQMLSNRTGMPVSDKSHGYERLVPVDEADLRADVNEDGSMRVLDYDKQRYSPLLGAPRLEGRLYQSKAV